MLWWNCSYPEHDWALLLSHWQSDRPRSGALCPKGGCQERDSPTLVQLIHSWSNVLCFNCAIIEGVSSFTRLNTNQALFLTGFLWGFGVIPGESESPKWLQQFWWKVFRKFTKTNRLLHRLNWIKIKKVHVEHKHTQSKQIFKTSVHLLWCIIKEKKVMRKLIPERKLFLKQASVQLLWIMKTVFVTFPLRTLLVRRKTNKTGARISSIWQTWGVWINETLHRG